MVKWTRYDLVFSYVTYRCAFCLDCSVIDRTFLWISCRPDTWSVFDLIADMTIPPGDGVDSYWMLPPCPSTGSNGKCSPKSFGTFQWALPYTNGILDGSLILCWPCIIQMRCAIISTKEQNMTRTSKNFGGAWWRCFDFCVMNVITFVRRTGLVAQKSRKRAQHARSSAVQTEINCNEDYDWTVV